MKSYEEKRRALHDVTTQVNDNLRRDQKRIHPYKSHPKRLRLDVTSNDDTDDDNTCVSNKENLPPGPAEHSDDLLKQHFDRLATGSTKFHESPGLDEFGGEEFEELEPDHRLEEKVVAGQERQLSQLGESEQLKPGLSDPLDKVDFTSEGAADSDEEVSSTQPMEPKWSKAIFNELQYVMRKMTRSTLDENDEDTYDVTMVAEYAPEIFNYMHELEHRLLPDAYYMDSQDELKWEMRSVLIDWVVQVHSRFNLLPETLFLTVNYIDRFLSKRKVSLSRFQLVGAVALFIAAKYEEINCPTVQEVAYMADNAYSVDDFLKAERFMIDVLEFDMGWPGPMSFLRRTSKADDYDYETRTLAKYFLEITIMDSRFVASQPSWLAAGAHYLSRKLLGRGSWSEAHVFYSGYTETQLRPLAEVLLQNCRNAETNHKAIFDKYSERRYRRSSTFVQEYFDAVER
ncbi:hypothetical protein PGUG_04059 [Meyerozyma guilliermondii ATCC 6260]|uniref:Uncharacterized protein n=1 Tax=Meyerozyma guilliermondii (strain ATCC 6260 / CBS 566 / DSM 6381 / JCM 1539 / NBRC 10279 / NRRL Y-324) TaxID=294746 RepID=A5DLA8_PICGU|nr:uncharacterized protein PGUG_04059 [Meyerozyma guilliermondii ATCC 6260]EDK39961.2 hypothetical protein PGUG_04059 [Meyerozyma guilliermondii ATCC 6260]